MYQQTAFLIPGAELPDPRNLPLEQYDGRNITGTRYLEIGGEFDISDINGQTGNQNPVHITVGIQDQLSLFDYDPAYSFRVITFGLESYSIRHSWNTVGGTGTPDGFVEVEREPIALICPQLTANTASRYFTLLPNDSGIGLFGAAQVSFFDKNIPKNLDITLALLNPNPTDSKAYNFNVNRLGATDTPSWSSQYIRAITVRLFIKATFQPNRIPVVGLNNQNVLTANNMRASQSKTGFGFNSIGGPAHMGRGGGGRERRYPLTDRQAEVILTTAHPPLAPEEQVAVVAPVASQLADGFTVGDNTVGDGGVIASDEVSMELPEPIFSEDVASGAGQEPPQYSIPPPPVLEPIAPQSSLPRWSGVNLSGRGQQGLFGGGRGSPFRTFGDVMRQQGGGAK